MSSRRNTDRKGQPTMTIRRYVPGDHRAVMELHRLALDAAGGYVEDGPWDSDLDNIESEYIDSGGEFLVGEYDGRIVAMGGLKKIDAATAKVRRMRVHPDYQRRGFGEEILRHLEAQALALGISRLALDTSVLLHGAMKFYSRHGYTRTHEEGEGDKRLIYYEKWLHSPDEPGR